ncbi:PAS domain-containing protein [Leptolyngbya sp. FACHB-16]|uniref:PAS domain-containing protein n=1 Tax=unclassified Leptolyngbya TaxID=2650499 RepID=UPI0016832A4D|nr:PAS domain-containing protein [Leptolyngbya sp. FACHB-16]MBD2153392.1 PAS domain-containing protein [Leptolyngbya sp. FACHB-16]
MSIHRTVLVIADPSDAVIDYGQQLQHDKSVTYKILSEKYDALEIPLSQSKQIDSILLELHSRTSSNRLLRQLKEQMSDRCPPIVVVDDEDTESAVQAFRNGAADYLVRDQFTPNDLCRAMERVIVNAELDREIQQHPDQTIETLKQLNQELTHRLAELQTLVDILPVGVAIASDPACTQMHSNAYLRQLLGVASSDNISKSAPAPNQPTYRTFRDGKEIAPEHLPMQVAGRSGEQVRDVEFDILLPDGTLRQLLCYATPLRNDQNQIRGVVGAFLDITERHQDAVALKASQQRYRELAEAMPQMIWTADANGVLTYRNQRWYEYTGMSVAESIGGPSTANAVHPDERELALKLWREAIATGEPFETECRFRRWDGEYHWFICRAMPTREGQGSITGWIGTITNIDNQKQLEAKLLDEVANRQQADFALQQSQKRLELAMEAAQLGSWDLDIQAGKVHWSTSLERLFGMAPGSFDGCYETARAMIHPDDLPWVEQAIHCAIYDRQDYNIEFRFIRPDGTVRWALGLGRVFYDASGNPITMTGVDMDISKRKQTEVYLRASEERFRQMADNAPMKIWVADATGYCTYLNQRWYKFTGQTEATGLGFGWLEAVHPDDREFSRAVFLNAVEHQTAFQLEYRLRRQDGEYCWAIDAASPWIGPEGELKGYIGSVVNIHDRKQAELALQEAHIQLESALAAGAIYTWRWNIAEDIAVTDSNCAYLFGIDPEAAAAGVPLNEFLSGIHPDDRSRIVASIEHAIATGEHYTEEYRVLNADGEERCVIARGQVEYDANGKAIAFPGALADTTERRKTEEALRFSEERYRTLFESMDEGFCVIEMIFDQSSQPVDYIFLETNPAFERQCGLYNVQGKRMRELIPHHENHWFEIYGSVAQTGIPIRFENSAEALQRWYDLYAYRVGLPDEHKVAVLFKDITERKLTEEALRQSEDRFRIAIESTQLGTWDLNPKTGVLKWDDRCKAVFGMSPTAKVDYDIFLAGLHPDDRDRTHQVVLQSFDPKGDGEYDIEYRTVGFEDGIERWVAAKGKAFFNPSGEVIRFIGTVLDITEKKRAEAEREQLLQREQAARTEAERANRIKDEFLAVLSHELRSPLNPILGWTKLLQLGRLDAAKTTEALATIERNVKLQTELIDDLLDVAKILRGKLSLNMAAVSLSSAVEAAIDTVGTAAMAKSISLHSVLPNVGQVFGDTARLQQIVWNLLSNAIKFTPQGGHVNIQLQQVGTEAHIIVKDTGKGISPDFLPHLFESFQQEDASITRKYGGLGLGLAIVRQLVEAHGGTITADSPGEGLGATFTVQLPLLSIAPENQPLHEHLEEELDLTGIRVLAIDDELDARELLTALLTQYGADVLTVASASEVLVNLEAFQPSVLVSDIAMPEIDGYTLIQQVRALPPSQGGQIPAIALTAYAREDDHQRAISSGFQRHITKPLEPERLVQAVVTLTRHKFNARL